MKSLTLELWQHGLLQGHGNSSDDVVVRTALQGRKHGRIDPRLEVLERLSVELLPDPTPEENEPGSGSSQTFVRRRRHDVGVDERARDGSGRNLQS